jgi:DNA-damage-inducible protein J
MASTSMLHVRVEDGLKAEASATLAAMGLSVSEAVRLFLTRVVAEQQMPFALTAAPGAAPQPSPPPSPEPAAKIMVVTDPAAIKPTGFTASSWFD